MLVKQNGGGQDNADIIPEIQVYLDSSQGKKDKGQPMETLRQPKGIFPPHPRR